MAPRDRSFAFLCQFSGILMLLALTPSALSQTPGSGAEPASLLPRLGAAPAEQGEAAGDGLFRGPSCRRSCSDTCMEDGCNTALRSLFVFGGFFSNGSMGQASQLWSAPYDGNSIVGLGYQHYVWTWGDLLIGGEIGVAGRFAQPVSGELWAGPTIRYDGLTVAHTLRIAPSFTMGLSAVTEAMGMEREREFSHNGSANLLFYLGPEIAVATAARPNIELFYRLHHRSGANGMLGHLLEGYNANVVGIRFRF